MIIVHVCNNDETEKGILNYELIILLSKWKMIFNGVKKEKFYKKG